MLPIAMAHMSYSKGIIWTMNKLVSWATLSRQIAPCCPVMCTLNEPVYNDNILLLYLHHTLSYTHSHRKTGRNCINYQYGEWLFYYGVTDHSSNNINNRFALPIDGQNFCGKEISKLSTVKVSLLVHFITKLYRCT